MLLAGCAAHRPARETAGLLSADRLREVCRKVRKLGRSGDWLVVRGTRPSADIVAEFTNLPVSHVAVLDRRKEEVIEAEGVGVHVSTLPDFIADSRRLLILRPIWERGDSGERAVEAARALVGKPYDYMGLVGINDPDKYFCSELAVEAYREFITEEDKVPPVVTPGQLYTYACIIYDSGP